MTVSKNTTRISGVSEAARRLGCTRQHLSQVIQGKRESKRLRAKARALGIRLPRI